ncbi:MAG: hypothetical protein HY238_16655 [Acidobacteria bacterium]|nr:hypothetical protein [Acidobacteriota bacterium]
MQRQRQSAKESGQAIILALVALSLFMFGAIGLAIDASQLYAQRQLAQNAADAAALAAMMSLFNGTNTSNATFDNTFGNITTPGSNPARLNCGSNDNHTPCYYARQNGLDPANGDTVYVDFWNTINAFAQEPGVQLSTAVQDPVPLLRVTIMRPVPATLMKFVGGGTSTVTAQATAAVVTNIIPVPILVLHPTKGDGGPGKNGALTTNGVGTTDKIIICGGPKRSIQVNSCAGTGSSVAIPGGGGSVPCQPGKSFTWSGNPIIDLSRAGPFDTGNCVTGTGGDFGNWGRPLPPVGNPSPVDPGTAGKYKTASPITDPLLNVLAPTTTGLITNPAVCTEPAGASACTDASGKAVTCPTKDLANVAVTSCTVLKPGVYTSAGPPGFTFSSIKKAAGYLIFTPGVYYIQSGGIHFDSNSTGQTQNFPVTQGVYPTCNNADATTGCGVLFFLSANGGTFTVDANASDLFLLGAAPLSPYKKILLFADHGAPTQGHSLGGGGTWNVTGTIYLTNTIATTLASIGNGGTGDGTYQSLSFNGTPLSGTVDGEIIVDRLDLGGTPNITMNLDPAKQSIRQVALVR